MRRNAGVNVAKSVVLTRYERVYDDSTPKGSIHQRQKIIRASKDKVARQKNRFLTPELTQAEIDQLSALKEAQRQKAEEAQV